MKRTPCDATMAGGGRSGDSQPGDDRCEVLRCLEEGA